MNDTASRGRICFGVDGSYTASRSSHHTSITLKNIGLGFRAQGLSTISHVVDDVQLKLDLLRQFVDVAEGAKSLPGLPASSISSAAAGGLPSVAGRRSRLEITDSISISQFNLEIGYLTPPVGLNLIVGMTAFMESFLTICRAVVPFVMLMSAVLVAVVWFPQLSLALLNR